MSNPYLPPETPYGMQPGGYPPQPGSDGLAIASLICGLLSLVVSLCCGIFGVPLSLAAIITGVLGLKTQQRGMAIAGLILGVIGLLITIGTVVFAIAMNWEEFSNL